MAAPELSVVVPSHFRPLRLRWLLNALYEQTLDRGRWEVIVGHDSGAETSRLLAEHPLAATGVLREARQATGTGVPATNRNVALGLARGETVVFTDDDCRPPREWLEQVTGAVRRHPGAIIQGPVRSDPAEAAMLRSSYPRSQHFDDVPRVWGECANIVYPRALLEELGGFAEEGWVTGEDTDLLLRALARGTRYVGEAAIATRHAVEEGTLWHAVRGAGRWRDVPALAARHPELREHFFLGVFWKASHGWLLVALGGAALGRRRPLAGLALCLPWAAARPVRGGGLRGALRHLTELPGWGLIDAAELGVLAVASIRERSAVL